jgi:hypothetical protein
MSTTSSSSSSNSSSSSSNEISEFSTEVYHYVGSRILADGYGLSCTKCKCAANMPNFQYCNLCLGQFEHISYTIGRFVIEFGTPLDEAITTVNYHYDNCGPVSSSAD